MQQPDAPRSYPSDQNTDHSRIREVQPDAIRYLEGDAGMKAEVLHCACEASAARENLNKDLRPASLGRGDRNLRIDLSSAE